VGSGRSIARRTRDRERRVPIGEVPGGADRVVGTARRDGRARTRDARGGARARGTREARGRDRPARRVATLARVRAGADPRSKADAPTCASARGCIVVPVIVAFASSRCDAPPPTGGASAAIAIAPRASPSRASAAADRPVARDRARRTLRPRRASTRERIFRVVGRATRALAREAVARRERKRGPEEEGGAGRADRTPIRRTAQDFQIFGFPKIQSSRFQSSLSHHTK
jgi:hypothetical protein